MLGLLYFGRLEQEKGFDTIIDMVMLYQEKHQELPFELFVFGSGQYEGHIQRLAHRHKTIHFFGRQPLATIRRYVSNCDYVLMPSRCLESFGLVALTGLARGIQPIGYAKGGATPFIDPQLDIGNEQGADEAEKLYHLIQRITEKPTHINSPSLQEYSSDNRKANFAYLAEGKKKILIVSDFKNRIGGIETYINDAQEILKGADYEVEIYGAKIPGGKRGKVLKILGMCTAYLNVREAINLRRKIKKYKPDIIRYNSILRYIGRLPLWENRESKAEVWMMYHDLGYVYPFPKRLENEEQIKYPFTLRNFVRSTKTKNPLLMIAIMGKFLLLKLIQRQLQKRVKKHLVPSPFLKPIIHKSYKIPDADITIFPHFIQE